ncbi:MAG TPA: biotin/lipoyl-containing protein [Acidobacteriaceae bacterium]|nr:biotin/lipoyl-containing protein [Acidobacteriaceae bacterium]
MRLDLDIEGQSRQVEVVPGDVPGRWQIKIDGTPIEADACLLRPGVLSLIIGGVAHRVVLDADPDEPVLHLGAQRIAWQADDPRSFRRRRRHGAAEGPVTLKASMPGRVIRVLVERGTHVAAHQGVIVIEAMKMQNELKSPKEGRVTELRVAPGDTVASGQVLAVIH